MTSRQGRLPSGVKKGVDLEPILKALGHKGRYQLIQLALNMFASFAIVSPIMDVVFVGYEPDYKCSRVDNFTQLEEHLPDDVTNFTLHDVSYQQCSIDVTVNRSGVSSTHSLPCVAGINFSMPADTSYLTEWSLVCEKAGLSEIAQSGMFGGQIAGSFFSSIVADRFGRKKVYIGCAFCMALSLIIRAFSPNFNVFCVSKAVSGFFLMGMANAAYTMFMELLPQKWRFVASVIDSFMWTLGCLVLALKAYLLQGFSWRTLSLALVAVFLVNFLLVCFLDESLRWLLATGEIQEAERLLQKACRMNGKDFSKIQPMLHDHSVTTTTTTTATTTTADNNNVHVQDPHHPHHQHQHQHRCHHTDAALGGDDRNCKTGVTGNGNKAETVEGKKEEEEGLGLQEEVFSAKYTVLDLFRYRVAVVPFAVFVFVWVSNSLYFYSTMLGSATLSGDRFLNFSLLNLQNIPSILVAICLLRRFNRRPLAFMYGFLAGALVLVSVALVVLGGEGVALTVATVAQFSGMFCLTGSYILLFVQYLEAFPTGLRAAAAGTTATVNRMVVMASPFLLIWAKKNPWAPGVFLGCLRLLSSFSIWFLPETRHRKLPDTIEEIEAWKRKDVSAVS